MSFVSLFRVGQRKVEDTCIGCGKCVEVCPFDAVRQDFTTHTSDCAFCQSCGGVCPTHAIQFVTRWHDETRQAPRRDCPCRRPPDVAARIPGGLGPGRGGGDAPAGEIAAAERGSATADPPARQRSRGGVPRPVHPLRGVLQGLPRAGAPSGRAGVRLRSLMDAGGASGARRLPSGLQLLHAGLPDRSHSAPGTPRETPDPHGTGQDRSRHVPAVAQGQTPPGLRSVLRRMPAGRVSCDRDAGDPHRTRTLRRRKACSPKSNWRP